MDKRALIGIALSVLVLVIYQHFINYYYGPPPTGDSPPAQRVSQTEKPSAPPPAPTVTATPAPVSPAAAGSGQPAREIVVDTDNYRAIFTSRGARLKSFRFKKFRVSADEKSPPFEMVSA